ncbi:Pvc16 family protein [Kitasatospora azatica]|uniref:Pvc16 family protein n=1 Tax=Kitasatospora azatica TaxID=58347 RepID=UPI0006907561|nr:Pvc16 family protein [Kitasatospora azatica]
MFQDLDATLKAMLADAAAPADLRAADISFDTPDKSFTPPQATVNLFLHDVQENRTLRDDAPLLTRANGSVTVTRPPLRVDCGYLVTTWSTKAAGLKAEEEHRLLGQALLWLSRFPEIDPGYLQGGLLNPPQLHPLPAMVAQLKEGQSMGQFWTALGIAPRPAFSLTVTIGLQPFDTADRYPAVQAVQLESTSLTFPALAGRVLTSALAPVAAAQVTVVEAGEQTTTDLLGGFAFPALAFGPYTLLVRITGRPDLRQPVSYAADNQLHNVVLAGP